jgi:enoyl-CoA hydratase/carnithine racemase
VRSIRRTMRRGLADRIRIATDHELVEQDWLRATEDFKEGIASTAERRAPNFQGR